MSGPREKSCEQLAFSEIRFDTVGPQDRIGFPIHYAVCQGLNSVVSWLRAEELGEVLHLVCRELIRGVMTCRRPPAFRKRPFEPMVMVTCVRCLILFRLAGESKVRTARGKPRRATRDPGCCL
jgi:hypothetical protein